MPERAERPGSAAGRISAMQPKIKLIAAAGATFEDGIERAPMRTEPRAASLARSAA
jgi:hypothetical protein